MIGLCVQNMITILDYTLNIFESTKYDHLTSMRIFNLIMSNVFI
jgi:hypothetical protein